MRRTIAFFALLMGVALALAASGPAHAEDPPGANGTVKIHDWPDHKNSSDMANDPKVCRFEIHGFGFDSGESETWWIQEHKWGSGDRSEAVLSGSYTADSNGDWTSGPHSLANGHYKLYVEMEHGTFKHKVFKVECGEVAGETPTPTPTPTPTGTAGATATPTPTPTPTPTTAGATATPTASPTVAGVQQPPGGGQQGGAQAGAQQGAQVAGQQQAPVTGLPSTSTEAGASLLAALIAGAGVFLLRRADR